jgi:hypothetical protein
MNLFDGAVMFVFVFFRRNDFGLDVMFLHFKVRQ